MADKLLILYNPDNKGHAHWAFIDEQNQCRSLGHGQISELAEPARGHRAMLLLDSSHVNINQVTIPTQNRQRQLQAIPFALEDILADDIEELHFAAGKRQPDGNIPVITINRSLLESVISEFKDAGVFLETVSADALALPVINDQWTLLIDDNRVLIKTSSFNAYYCDLDLISVFLPALFGKLDIKPSSLLVYCKQQQLADTEQLKDLELETKTELYRETPAAVFAANLAIPAQLNILQGTYTPKRHSSGLLKPWKSVAAIFIVWLCMQLIYAGTQIRQLEKKNTELASLIQKEFKKANPATKNYSNMKKRMAQKLAEIRGDSNNESNHLFLKILSEATPALSSSNKLTINGIIFRNKFVDLDLQADSLQTLESIKTKLAATPGIKTVMSTSVEKDQVKGRLRLEEQS